MWLFEIFKIVYLLVWNSCTSSLLYNTKLQLDRPRLQCIRSGVDTVDTIRHDNGYISMYTHSYYYVYIYTYVYVYIHTQAHTHIRMYIMKKHICVETVKF